MPYEEAVYKKLFDKLKSTSAFTGDTGDTDYREGWAKAVLEMMAAAEDGTSAASVPKGVPGAPSSMGAPNMGFISRLLVDLVAKRIVPTRDDEPWARMILEKPGVLALLPDENLPNYDSLVIAAFQVTAGLAPTGKLNRALAQRLRAYIVEL